MSSIRYSLALGLALGAWGCTARLGALGSETGLPSDSADGAQGGEGSVHGPEGAGGRDPGGGTSGAGGASSDRPAVAPTQFECDPSLPITSAPLRRLTQRQYANTVRDLIERSLGPSEAELVWMELSDAIHRITADERAKVAEDLHGSYRRLDQRVQQAHVDAYFETGTDVARALTNESRLEALLGPCAEESESSAAEACITAFVERFGTLALRKPLSQAEVEFYRTFYEPSTGIDPQGVQDIITGLLNAPGFLYLIEHGQAETTLPNTYELAPYELASRLSYHFWDTLPDARLFELAETGELTDEDVYQAEVERLWSDSKTHTTITEFFREWLKLEEIPELDRNNEAPVFQAFTGENLPSPELKRATEDEVLELLDYFTWKAPSGVDEIFLTQKSFARSPELAALYGIEAWDGREEPPTFPESRPGILTRAAFLATGTPSTRPIMKGYFIRKNVLCDSVPSPPGNAAASPPELSEDLTTREVVEGLTESGPCADCHRTYLNPLGFATEGFDSLGRTRTEQILFDAEGKVRGQKPIDTRSVPQVILGDDSPSNGPDDLMKLLTESGKIEACFVRHYFRFSFGRWEGVISDGCVLEGMLRSLKETGSIADMLRAVALTDAFRSRSFSDSSAEATEP